MVVDHDVNLLVSVPSCGLRLVLPYARIPYNNYSIYILLSKYYSRVHRCTLASMHTVVVCILILLATIVCILWHKVSILLLELVVATLVVVLMYAYYAYCVSAASMNNTYSSTSLYSMHTS